MRGEVGMEKIYHTQDRNYTLRFEPLSNSNGTVHFIDHYKEEESTVGFTVDDREFGYRVQQNFPSIIADLIRHLQKLK